MVCCYVFDLSDNQLKAFFGEHSVVLHSNLTELTDFLGMKHFSYVATLACAVRVVEENLGRV